MRKRPFANAIFAARPVARVAASCFLVGILLGPVPPSAFAEGRTYLEPEEGEEARILTEGTVRTYYEFSADEAAELSLTGPTTLTLLIRAVFSPGMPDTVPYGVAVHEGDRELLTHWTTTRRSGTRFVPDSKDVPGLSRKLSVDVPEGSHELSITLLGDKAKRAVTRFYVPGEYQTERYVSIAPLDPGRTLTAVGGEKQIRYYPIVKDSTVVVRIVGPTKLRILSRLLFDFALHGRRHYTLVIDEEGKPVREVTLATTRSTSVVFEDAQGVVPGKNKVTLLEVPKGVHRFGVRLGPDSDGAAAVRFTIPVEDLSNEAKSPQ